MSEYMDERNTKFLNYWERKRTNKTRFYLANTIGWGLIGGNLAYFWQINFKLDQFVTTRYFLYIIFWILGGLLWAHIQYRTQEKQYRKLKDQSGT